MTSTELEQGTIDSSALEDMSQFDVDTILAILTGEITIVQSDNAEISKDMMRRVLQADTVEDVLSDQSGLTEGKDLLNIPLEVQDFEVRTSTLDGPGVYLAVSATNLHTGEQVVFSTSAQTAMAQLARLKWLGKLPQPVKLVQAAKPTSGGFYPQRFVAPTA